MITCNHDTPRVCPDLTPEEAKLAYAFLLTLPGVPFIYYGDEIGMRYQAGMPTKEGGYTRTGTRTPMQWAAGKNLGFSGADASLLYLPVDASPDAPTVAAQEGDYCGDGDEIDYAQQEAGGGVRQDAPGGQVGRPAALEQPYRSDIGREQDRTSEEAGDDGRHRPAREKQRNALDQGIQQYEKEEPSQKKQNDLPPGS